jgi:hypothetical protein
MGNIFSENPVTSIAIVAGIFGIWAAHRLMLYRDKKGRFDETADEFRKVFNAALVDICEDKSTFIGNATILDDERIKLQRIAYLNLRAHMRGNYLRCFDQAWECYYDDYRYQQYFDDSAKEIIERDIHFLLKFADHRLSFRSLLVWHRYTYKYSNRYEKQLKRLLEIKGKIDQLP